MATSGKTCFTIVMTVNNTIKLAFLKFRQIDGIILVEIGVE